MTPQVGQLAWIIEKFRDWTDPAVALPEDAVDLDHLLTNVTLYWLTGTGATSAHLYYETRTENPTPPQPIRRAHRSRRLSCRPSDPAAAGARAHHPPLDRIHPWRPFRRSGSPRSPRRRHHRVLHHIPLASAAARQQREASQNRCSRQLLIRANLSEPDPPIAQRMVVCGSERIIHNGYTRLAQRAGGSLSQG